MRIPLALACLALAAPASATTYTVDVGPGMSFSPSTLTITAGDTVRFANHGGLHNAKADDNSFRCANGCDNDGHGGNGAPSYAIWFALHAFNTPGTIGYYCETHGTATSGMRGTIIVQPMTPVELQSFSVD